MWVLAAPLHIKIQKLAARAEHFFNLVYLRIHTIVLRGYSCVSTPANTKANINKFAENFSILLCASANGEVCR